MLSAIPAPRDSTRFRQRLVGGMTVLGLLAVGAVSWKIYSSNTERQQVAQKQTQAFVYAIEANVLHMIKFADASLNGFANGISALPPQQRESAPAIAQLLAANGTGDGEKFQTIYINADGVGVAASNPIASQGVSYADRDYFLTHRGERGGHGLYVGQPAIAEEHGQRVFFLSRRVESAAGKFLGVVAAQMDASRIATEFDRARFGQNVSILLAHRGGKVVVRVPQFEQTFAAEIAQTDVFRRLAGAPVGNSRTASKLDGQERVYSYRALENLPLLVAVSIASSEWEDALREDILAGAGGLALMTVLMCLGVSLAVRSYTRLERSEDSYRRLYSSIRDGVVLIDCADCIAECNEAFLAIVGYDAGEIIGSDFLPWSPDQWRSNSRRLEQDALDQYEKECRHKNGEAICLSIKLWPVNYGGNSNTLMMLALVRDITAQKRAQNALRYAHDELEVKVHQRTVALVRTNEKLKTEITERKLIEDELRRSTDVLQQLSAHQERIKEVERKRIAREIHDDLGQTLLALRIDVSMMHARTVHNHPKLHRKASAVLENIDTAIRSVRSIINDLRPATLELGLDAAIEWQVREFERISGIACRLTVDSKGICFDREDERALALFRILQESLTNIARHAKASAAEVALRAADGRLLLRIHDNGIGIQPSADAKPNAFGLVGMRERIHSLGGELHIEGSAGQGTMVSVVIALEKNATVQAL
ncbi:PAS domain S-box protein [Noviherbaspirillum sedimenti]|uniref:PAS domain S-box protein n=1 Tax=Noviherbaspirillum sedimenti TaxID=2320865 RepID=A0A3A3GPY7_9BURK|nr:PAS domain S-box protein [Noviherbaspirillum sedimenti]RJG03060.1 PAS domain S-box protein [Noviherbaspirillum sedimenti]